ncbi:hypothetical protein Pan153_27460 [Gimesia panareensis]|uniref:Uncharacterized protein n=2 Tax=Gimesia panareensis TaxID=2527978 RepID=A0A518FP21_9PLAN|nr:hypothetical protein Pan153_27460 [Gimesia panareensis]
MKQRVRNFSWIIGILGLLGVLLQSLQVQIEHTHTGGESTHSHSHGHAHGHSHGHSHSHSHAGHSHGHAHSHDHQPAPATKIAQAPHRHVHITLLWWEFTMPLPASDSDQTPVAVVREEEIEEAETRNGAAPPGGLCVSAIPIERLISELVSSWMSITPPARNRVPVRDSRFAYLSATAACYQRLRDTPPVPPPQRTLSVSFS